jgi:hypothetical protein
MGASTALTLEDAAAHLAAIAGEEHTSLREGVIDVAPANVEEISGILRFASANELSVTPLGGGPRQDGETRCGHGCAWAQRA